MSLTSATNRASSSENASRQGDIPAVIDQQTVVIERLEFLADRLEGRLASALNQTPQPKSDAGERVAYSTPLADQVDRNSGRVHIVNDRLSRLLDQLEL